MDVDSFRYLPRLIATFYRASERQPEYPIPWTPLRCPLSECQFGLVTSGGLYQQGVAPPFDVARERRDPTWGDPSYRIIPADIRQTEVGVSHLHINAQDVLADLNILLPVDRFQELVSEGYIGGLASRAFSFMGYQGFPPDTRAWQEVYGPQIAAAFKAEGVSAALLTPRLTGLCGQRARAGTYARGCWTVHGDGDSHAFLG
jgi:D-proline reductase (dithiol) PrdB